MKNLVKEKLRNGEPVFGQMVLDLFSPGLGPMLANCGLDFVIFDMEHGRCDIALAAELIASCRGAGIVPTVRVPDLATAPLSRVLDIGARGVMVPRIETADQMRDIVAQLKYAPEGRRGVALGIAHDLYRPGAASFFREANDDVLIIALVETVRGFENLDDIAAVPGIDILWVGHYDLTVSMGIPAQFDHPSFLEKMDRLVEVCGKHGIAPGFMPASPEDCLAWIHRGIRAISVGSDVGMFQYAVRGYMEAVRAQLPRATGA